MAYVSSDRAAATRGESALGRVRKLLAKAEDPAVTPAEAEAYNTKAAELIAAYGIDRALLAAEDPDLDIVGDRVVVMDAPYARDKADMLGWVALTLGCQAVRRTRHPDGQKELSVHLFGHQSNLERTELLFTSLLVQSAHALATTAVPAGESKAAFRRSWLHGFGLAVTRRLEEAEAGARSEAQERTAADGRCVDLVLADRSHEVVEALQAAYPHLGQAKGRRLTGSGHVAGWEAGQRADIGVRPVGGSPNRAIGR